MVQLSATMEQTQEVQLAQLYNVLGFRLVIVRYDVLSTLHETGPGRFLCRITFFPVQNVVVVGCAHAHVYAHMHANLGLGKTSMPTL